MYTSFIPSVCVCACARVRALWSVFSSFAAVWRLFSEEWSLLLTVASWHFKIFMNPSVPSSSSSSIPAAASLLIPNPIQLKAGVSVKWLIQECVLVVVCWRLKALEVGKIKFSLKYPKRCVTVRQRGFQLVHVYLTQRVDYAPMLTAHKINQEDAACWRNQTNVWKQNASLWQGCWNIRALLWTDDQLWENYTIWALETSLWGLHKASVLGGIVEQCVIDGLMWFGVQVI